MTFTMTATPTNTETFTITPTHTYTPTSTVTPTISPTPAYILSVKVYNSAGEIVRTVAIAGAYGLVKEFSVDKTVISTDDGSVAVINVDGYIYEWDGRSDQGTPVQNGVYYVKAETTDNMGLTHAAVREVTVLTNGLTAELRVYNSAGEIVKIIPVYGLASFGSDILTLDPAAPAVFVPGQPQPSTGQAGLRIDYMGQVFVWDGTSEQGVIVANGVYSVQLVGIDASGVKTIASSEITVMNAAYEVISGIKVIPNPVNPLVENIITIRYNLMPGAKVTVKAYNIAGELVKGMEDYAGIGQVKWQLDAKVAPGIYILVINAGTDSGMRKTMVEKLAIFYK